MRKKLKYILPILIIGFVVGGYAMTQPANSLVVDVNPSIEIVTNRLDRVVEINPLNSDAEELLKDFNPKDKDLERTVNDLVDLMILTGHIRGGDDNFVMITVTDDLADSRVVDKVNETIKVLLQNKQIEATVLNQSMSRGDIGKKQTGAQIAAQKIPKVDGGLTAEELSTMTIKELVYYSKANNIPVEKLFNVAVGKVDQPAREGIISVAEAKRIALQQVNGQVIKVELDDLYDDDNPEYEIEIMANGVKYEIEIDARTGRVKEVDRDDDDDRRKSGNVTAPAQKVNTVPSGRITAEEAKAIALKRTGGGIITEFERDDGEFEIEIKFNGKEYEIEIDARTGQILDFEVEDDD